MRASLIIPTYNRLAALQQVLRAVDELLLPAWAELEVVVVDDGSSDGSREWLARQRRPRFHALSQANAGPAKARNVGVAAARGDIVLFLGDDTVPERRWLLEHLQTHRLGEPTQALAVVGYTTFPDVLDGRFSRHINEFGAQFGYLLIEDPAAVPFNFFYTSNISLRRDVFLAQGGFREDFPAAAWEDIEFAYRASRTGLKLVYQPRARTEHHHRIRPETFCSRQRTSGRSAAIFAELHPELAHFLGVHRPRSHSWGGRPLRCALRWLILLGEGVPGLVPPPVYQRYLDMSYLEGLAEGLHSRGRR